MVCPVQMPAIVRARHAWLDEGQIRRAIQRGLDGVGDKLRRGTRVLEESAHHGVDDVEAEVRRVLQNARLGVRLTRPVMEAYSREPHPSRFGISQALTLAAQSTTPKSGSSSKRRPAGTSRAAREAVSASSLTALRRFINANTETLDQLRPTSGRTSPSWQPRSASRPRPS